MSRPSKTTLPPVGSSSRVTSRPVVDLPQPDSPTRPSVSPARTVKSMPSTARTAPTLRLKKAPRVIGKCFSQAGAPRAGSRRLAGRACPVGRQCSSGARVLTVAHVVVLLSGQSAVRCLGEDPLPVGGREVAGDAVVGVPPAASGTTVVHGMPLQPDVRAARVERAAGRQVDQAGRGALDRHQPVAHLPVEAGHRAEQAPGVGVLAGARKIVLRGAVLDALAAVHDQDVVGQLGDDAEVVGDDDDRGAELLLQVADQVEDLRLHGDVERGGRLVGDQQLRGC